MTIYDISEKANVSIATVSRVLNGSSSVSEQTKQKVLDIINQYDYTPNAFARGLGLNTMRTIGIMCADSSDLYLAKAIYFLEQNLRAQGYDCLLSCTGYELEDRKQSIGMLLNKKVDGIVLVGSNFIYQKDTDNKYIADAAAVVPVMLLNGSLDIPNTYSVVSDDYTSMYEATTHLIHSGIKKIVYFYNSNSYSGKKKLSGYQAAMDAHHLPVGKDLLHYFSGSHEDFSAMKKELMGIGELGKSIHGLIAADDALALAAIKCAKEKGLSIPADLSIIGYNNSMLAICCEPELSSIDNKLESLCEHLSKILMDVLEGKKVPKKTVFAGELIKRGTTLPN
jgi:LacI family transcriptional regulator/LacI family asc operon transcriptional repressor